MRLSIQNKLLYLFFFSLNFEIWDPLNTEGSFSVAKLTGFLYAFSLIPKLGHFLIIPHQLKSLVRLILFFYAFIVIINLINLNNFSSDFLFFSFLQNIILFLMLLNHERLNPGTIEKGFISFFLGSIALAGFYFLGIGVETSAEGRVSLFGDNENIIGVRMVVSSLILTHIILKYKQKIFKIVYYVLPLLYFPFVLLILKTGSRLSFISLFLGFSIIFILYQNKNIVSKILVLVIGAFTAIFLFDLAMQSEVLGVRLTKTAESGHLGGRDEIWFSLLPLIENNWLIGVGKTGYAEYAIRFYGVLKSPHNVIVEVLAYTGIIGLLLFLSFVFKSFWYSFKYLKYYNEIVPFIFVIPISGILLSAQILTFKLGWVIIAYAASRKLYLNQIIK
jgi:hypothetical protein